MRGSGLRGPNSPPNQGRVPWCECPAHTENPLFSVDFQLETHLPGTSFMFTAPPSSHKTKNLRLTEDGEAQWKSSSMVPEAPGHQLSGRMVAGGTHRVPHSGNPLPLMACCLPLSLYRPHPEFALYIDFGQPCSFCIWLLTCLLTDWQLEPGGPKPGIPKSLCWLLATAVLH